MPAGPQESRIAHLRCNSMGCRIPVGGGNALSYPHSFVFQTYRKNRRFPLKGSMSLRHRCWLQKSIKIDGMLGGAKLVFYEAKVQAL